MPLDLDAKRRILREVSALIHTYTHGRAVALIDFETMELASGTLVKIEQHIFIATASHVVPFDPNGRLMLLGNHPRRFGDGSPAFRNYATQGSAGRDVAFLEVEPDALEWLGKQPLSLDLLEDRGSGNPQMFTAITGFPTQTVGDPIKTGQVVPAYISIGLLPIADGDYGQRVAPVPAADAPPDAQRDVFLDYREEDARRIDTYEQIDLPAVGGMSGGAYYDFGQFAEGVLWHPDQLRFYAIQSSWNNRAVNPYVRGTQIVHWAKLVADNYPALRDILRRRFPRLDAV